MVPETTIRSVMTDEVYFLEPDDTMAKAQEFFQMHSIHHLPVLDKSGTVLGIVSREDASKLVQTYTLFNAKKTEEDNQFLLSHIDVEEVMSRQISTVQPEDSIYLAASIFRQNLIHALPVVDDAKKLVGILTTHDLLMYSFQKKMPLTGAK